ncbi:ribosome small subunit biogenesis protein, BUD22 family [Schizosaccharomyces osmophilus]|uniref:Ribosome small subunit biogenesis protein, BUD22 family n=1 Tax=Schizosaccharomyces osmophilus TaxID=2545709 RepID=A0AAF0AW63_9SCHI|nr:ribosome small subunit biogenesis protein, BUD22 family [Schizosaccharomyces osmophilus]WBW74326.1 ribosome small subunit biogenesis protein, BUD22 family [Schizosaccharomyces osmophilus]
MKHHSNKANKPKSSKPRLSPEDLQKRSHHFRKQLTHALKKAVGFERQKLARRIKSAREQQENDKVARYEKEFDFSKKYDFSKLTEFCFHRKVLRNKEYRILLDEHKPVEFPSDITNDEEKNVVARLLNSNPISESVNATCRLLDKCILMNNPEADFTKSRDQNMSLTAEPKLHPDGVRRNPSLNLDKSETESERVQQKEPEKHELFTESSISPEKNASIEQPHEENFRLEKRKVSSEEDVNLEDKRNTTMEDNDTEDEMFTIPSTKSSANNIPELATGFLDPLGEDDEFVEKEMDEMDRPKRKNRRGQRARQAIWEKKFGKTANHVVKKKEQEQLEREERQHKFNEREAKRAQKAAIATSQEPDKLHPSWEAKKKQKLQPAGTFQGKKIVFD